MELFGYLVILAEPVCWGDDDCAGGRNGGLSKFAGVILRIDSSSSCRDGSCVPDKFEMEECPCLGSGVL